MLNLKTKVLKSGKFGLHESGGEAHVFHLKDAGRAKIRATWFSSDGKYDYYKGLWLDAGEREGEIEWSSAWVLTDAQPWIRVNHKKNTIEIFKYEKK